MLQTTDASFANYTRLATWLNLETPNLLMALPSWAGIVEGHAHQSAPALPFDRLTCQDATLLRTEKGNAPAISVEEMDCGIILTNGDLALKLVGDGYYDGETPGPIVSWRFGEAWRGSGSVRHLPCRTAVRTTIDSIGPVAVQWTTEWRWGSEGCWRWQARWTAGSDTLEVAETMTEDTGATWEWLPMAKARAWVGGGGERPSQMQPLIWRPTPGARSTVGRKLLTPLAHISYFNQWNKSWVAFESGGGVIAGIFSGWGGVWQKRGYVRPLVWDDPEQGALLQFPIRQGLRCYGLVFAATDITAECYCLLNQRKRDHSDFSPGKIRHWLCDLPLPERESQLLPKPLPEDLPCRPVSELREIAEKSLVSAKGGYEGIIIFDGRRLKSIAFDVDAMWADGRLAEQDYRDIRRIILFIAQVFEDPDYCTYGDFWPHFEPEEGIADALKNEMGDCPVPPNFASEFFSTTGIAAELFPAHPYAELWRAFAMAMTRQFLKTFFAPDGTYAESINYHTHALSELLCHFYPLWRNGHHDFFTHPAVKGSYQHIVQLQMPHLAEEGCAPLPANGNSGNEGKQQPFRGELVIGINAYRWLDPDLAAQLVHVWETGGRPGPEKDHEHPVLTAALLGQALPDAVAAPVQSAHRQTLGVVSKATRADGTPIWALFRAGNATHHMDFDQGHLMLAAGDKVLLGDHGYHTHDTDGKGLPAAATWLHSTLTYAEDTTLSSGYTGLEQAPEPSLVHLGEAFDWCVLPIVNTDFRDLSRLSYRDMAPTPPIRHTRHYLFLKPDIFVLWDVVDLPSDVSALPLRPTFWLHSPEPWIATLNQAWRAGPADALHLDVNFASPGTLATHTNRQVGPLHALGLRNNETTRRAEFLAVLRISDLDTPLTADWASKPRVLRLESGLQSLSIHLPEPASNDLPRLQPR